MLMRPVWKGILSVGSAEIPIRMYPAITSKNLNLVMLHKACCSRIKHDKKCPLHGPVPSDEIINAYAYEEDKYVPISKADLDNIQLDSKKTITLSQFIDFDQIDPIYFYRSYYLIPDGPIAGETYAILRNALKRKRKMALAQIVLRQQQFVAALWPKARVIVLTTLHYESEIRQLSDLEDIRIKAPRKRALRQSTYKIIDELSKKFKPKAFRDNFRDQFLKIIKMKIDRQKSLVPYPLKAEAAEVTERNERSDIRDIALEKKRMTKLIDSEKPRKVSTA